VQAIHLHHYALGLKPHILKLTLELLFEVVSKHAARHTRPSVSSTSLFLRSGGLRGELLVRFDNERIEGFDGPCSHELSHDMCAKTQTGTSDETNCRCCMQAVIEHACVRVYLSTVHPDMRGCTCHLYLPVCLCIPIPLSGHQYIAHGLKRKILHLSRRLAMHSELSCAAVGALYAWLHSSVPQAHTIGKTQQHHKEVV
jgi:hypothetical protein